MEVLASRCIPFVGCSLLAAAAGFAFAGIAGPDNHFL
jgi:hypothetical protein